MMPSKRTMNNEEEKRRFKRECYEYEKEDIIAFYHQQGWKEDGLKECLVNSLKKDYEAELKEDGLI